VFSVVVTRSPCAPHTEPRCFTSRSLTEHVILHSALILSVPISGSIVWAEDRAATLFRRQAVTHTTQGAERCDARIARRHRCMSETSALTTDTGFVQAVERGDAAALTALFSLVYDELSILAHQQRRRWHGEHHARHHRAGARGVSQDGGTAPARIQESRAFLRRRREGDATHPVQLRARPKPEEAWRPCSTFDSGPDRRSPDSCSYRTTRPNGSRRSTMHCERWSVSQTAGTVVECRFFGGMSLEDTATRTRHITSARSARLDLRPRMASA
jgi:hypothetical protein